MIHCFASACFGIDRLLIGPVNSSRLIRNLQIELNPSDSNCICTYLICILNYILVNFISSI